MAEQWKQPSVWISVVTLLIVVGGFLVTHGQNLQKLKDIPEIKAELQKMNDKLDTSLQSNGVQNSRLDRHREDIRDLKHAVFGSRFHREEDNEPR